MIGEMMLANPLRQFLQCPPLWFARSTLCIMLCLGSIRLETRASLIFTPPLTGWTGFPKCRSIIQTRLSLVNTFLSRRPWPLLFFVLAHTPAVHWCSVTLPLAAKIWRTTQSYSKFLQKDYYAKILSMRVYPVCPGLILSDSMWLDMRAG